MVISGSLLPDPGYPATWGAAGQLIGSIRTPSRAPIRIGLTGGKYEPPGDRQVSR
jgi:hypothetical protein